METCTNLNNAKVGQYVKWGTTRDGVKRVEQIVKVWKNGRIDLGGHKNVYRPEPNGTVAFPTGRTSPYSTYSSVIYAFDDGETAEAVQESLKREAQARAEAQAIKDAAREAEAQRKIAAACIEHSAGRDIAGSGVARWTDSRGNARTTLYFAKEERMYGAQGWHVQIADFENGSFGSSFATSLVSPEDAVNRWIASWS